MNNKVFRIINNIFIIVLTILMLSPICALAETYKTNLISVNERTSFKVGDVIFNDIYYQIYPNNNTFSLIGSIDTNIGRNLIITIYYYNSNGTIIGSINKNIIVNPDNYIYTVTSNSSDLNDRYTALDIKYFMIVVSYNDESIVNLTPSQNSKYSSYDYVIDKYNVDIVVNENNTLDVTEYITVYFNKEKHGIIRYIPYVNEIKRLDGTSSKVSAQIYNIHINDKYTKKVKHGYLNLSVGSKELTKTGTQNYIINYTYNLGKDKQKDYDELYFNVIGTGWNTVIGNVTFSIIMPKDFDSSKLSFSSGNYGSTENDKINYELNGNKIIGSYNGILDSYNGLTVICELPEGYFVNAKYNVQKEYLFLYLIPTICLIISAIIWYFYGKNKKIIETVEFYAPDNLNSLEVGYLYKGKAEDNDVVSLLIYLADKGYIKISDIEEKILFLKRKGFKITLLKDYDGNNINERLFLQNLFSLKINYFDDDKNNDIDEVTSFDLVNSFYMTVKKIKHNMNSKDNKYKVFEKKSLCKKKYVIFMMIITYLVINLPLFVISQSDSVLADMLIPILGTFIFMKLFFGSAQALRINNTPVRSKFVTKMFGIIFGIIFGTIWYMRVVRVLNINSIYIMQYILGLVSLLGMYICLRGLSKRTKYGLEILGKIKGFKKFLKTAEKDKLQALVNENPYYFYNILPYAYVLNVPDKWIKKFEDITLIAPNWYDSATDFSFETFNLFIDSTMSKASLAMTSTPSNSDSSSGDSSGRFSG